ncbi:hypothetical protein HPB48_005468 [Haemaphysalis longicornis]|uniref:Sulfotransferase domain-containing protein n=1 Tax=Haemaphysalis longicornis TaxID=44386 RepID=A0A9J6H1P5_HAELO|nr:hypothetical protein HPB48_005468 [Haemaphysalis longicornis]
MLTHSSNLPAGAAEVRRPTNRRSFAVLQGVPLPAFFLPECIDSASKYKPTKDDLYIVTYVKCGTTWTQHVVYLIQTGGVPPPSAEEFYRASPYIEVFGAECVEWMKKPGALKTHLPCNLWLASWGPEYEANLLKDDRKGLRDVVKYSSVEEMKKYTNDMIQEFFAIGCEFRGDEFKGLQHFHHGVHAAGQDAPGKINYVRKGVIGDWKNHFSPEQLRRLNEKFKRDTEGSDIANILALIWVFSTEMNQRHFQLIV